jgi:PAS domain S-box-containing protein
MVTKNQPCKNDKNIIIINDDLIQLKVLSTFAIKAGFNVSIFSGAEEMLREAKEPPDLIITDIHMPVIDGWKLCRLLKSPEYPHFNQVPILVVSATFAGDEPEKIATDLGANAFLSSPVNRNYFIEKIHELIKGKQKNYRQKVLIVEDSPVQSEIFRSAFNIFGYETGTALNIKEAKNVFSRDKYDICLLDYILPDGKGDELLEYFIEKQPDCTCIMISSEPNPELTLSWMKKGAAAFVSKPFEPNYLIEICARARRERILLRAQDLLELRTRELKQNEAKLKLALKVAKMGYWSFNCSTKKIELSEETKKLFGINPENFDNRLESISQVILPEDLKHIIEKFNRTLNENTPFECTYRVLHPNGKMKWLHSQSQVQFNNKGELEQIFGITRDITEEKERTENQQLQALVLDQIQDMVTITDLNGTITYVNKAQTRQLGYPQKELCGKPVAVYRDNPEYGETQENILRKTLQEGQWEGEVVNLTKENKERILYCRNQIIYDEKNNPRALCGIATDITEKKQAEIEKNRLQDQLYHAQKMESIGRLAGGIAHDFNNMLSVIIGYSEMCLQDMNTGNPLFESLCEIHNAALKSSHLTRQLLGFARKQNIKPIALKLNKTIEEIKNMLTRLIGENIELEWQPLSELPLVKMDPSQIDQILTNLCINARDAITDKGIITIETNTATFSDEYCAVNTEFKPGNFVVLSVSDNGCGMTNETMKQLFEPFFTTKEKGKGTGLGLCTVYGIVHQNKGFINVRSTPDKGSCFRVYLPVYHEKKPEITNKDAKINIFGNETIMIVEDEPAILKMSVMLLENLGYQVIATNSPHKAISEAAEYKEKIHLLITDVVMPEMNGKELSEKILSLHPETICLFMSGHSEDIVSHQGILAEEINFIQKPFFLRELGQKIREVLMTL